MRLGRLAAAAIAIAGPARARGVEGRRWPAPPFGAEVAVASVYARERPRASAPPVGLLEMGDRLVVTGCAPACDEAGWALLGGDGAVRLRHLRPSPEPPPAAEGWPHGTVRRGGAQVRAAPDPGSEVAGELPEGWVVAFRPRPDLEARGWLELARGGFVRRERTRPARPSAFAGERDPDLPLAFFRREVELRGEDGRRSGWRAPRHARLHVLGLQGRSWVRVEGGLAPRSAVRIALPRSRPARVPPAARWVDVDLRQQVLTAYEGDRPVFATLVSTGAGGPERETAPGLYQVTLKVRSGEMSSERWGYHLEDVPDILYFHGDDGIHAAFWHDRFGEPVSHGCVNLSPADARWLFAWSPPRLPPGWHAAIPLFAGRESLWVRVERAPPSQGPGGGAPLLGALPQDAPTRDP